MKYNDDSEFQFPKIDIKPIVEAISTFVSNLKPFQEMVSALKDKVRDIVDLFAESMRPIRALDPLACNQYVIWEYKDDEFINLVLSSENINKTLRLYHEKDKYHSVYETVNKCNGYINDKNLRRLFNQAVDSFMSGNTDLAVVGFVAVIDGLLALINESTSTRIAREFDALVKKLEDKQLLNDSEYAMFSLLYTFNKTVDVFTRYSQFGEKEPEGLNRHWIAHGRSKRKKTKLDCVKLINLIFGIILIDAHAKE